MPNLATEKRLRPDVSTSMVNSRKLIDALLDTQAHTPADRDAYCRACEFDARVGHNFVYVGVIEPLDNIPLEMVAQGSKANSLSGHPGFALPTLLIQEGCCDDVVDLVKSLDSKGIQFVVNVPRSSNMYDACDTAYITRRILAECSGNVSIPGVG
jgi:hypothetical protein